jgi:hypothetical protein
MRNVTIFGNNMGGVIIVPRTLHLAADIRGMLENHKRKGSLKGVFKDSNGKPLTDEEARDYLYGCLAKGWRVIPFGDCDNFDYQTGCKGHPTKAS